MFFSVLSYGIPQGAQLSPCYAVTSMLKPHTQFTWEAHLLCVRFFKHTWKYSILQYFQYQWCTTSVMDIAVLVGQNCVLGNIKCILYILLGWRWLFSFNNLIYFFFLRAIPVWRHRGSPSCKVCPTSQLGMFHLGHNHPLINP